MAKKKTKTANREPQKQNPPRKKYTTAHDQLYSKEIAPRMRRMKAAAHNKNWDEYEKLRKEVEELKKEYRILLHRRIFIEK